MKIKKTLFSTEIEFEPNEFTSIMDLNPPEIYRPIIKWLNHNFGFAFLKEDKE